MSGVTGDFEGNGYSFNYRYIIKYRRGHIKTYVQFLKSEFET